MNNTVSGEKRPSDGTCGLGELKRWEGRGVGDQGKERDQKRGGTYRSPPRDFQKRKKGWISGSRALRGKHGLGGFRCHKGD